MASRALFRQFVYRCGRVPQSQIRAFCEGPPDGSSEAGKKPQAVTVDKQNKNENNVEKEAKHEATEEKLQGSPEQDVIEATKLKEKGVHDKKAAARKKLNDLLISLATVETVPIERTSKLKLARPKARTKAPKKTEVPKEEHQNVSSPPPPPIEEIQIEPKLAEATKEVAESLGGDVKATESELLSTLRSHASENSLNDRPTTNLSELFVGMKVERSQSKPMVARQQRGRFDEDPTAHSGRSFDEESRYKRSLASAPKRMREFVSVELFGSKPLGIFSKTKDGEENLGIAESVLPVWDAIHRRELKRSVTNPAPNGFVEMIQWTKQGKLWTFPIDNETGLEEEKQIGFHEHIFLEHHLEGWCPKRGPIRHFMELVCVGLSKNPYLTVERKQRHIQWYKDYFEAKRDKLEEIGAIEVAAAQ